MMKIPPDGWDKFRAFTGMNLIDSIDMMGSILEAKTSDDLRVGLESAAKRCGFNTFVSGVQLIAADGSFEHNVISAYPAEWQRMYANRGYMWKDPTVIHCQTSLRPLVWGAEFFEQNTGADIWEEAKAFGLSDGISVSMHDLSGSKSMLSLVRDKCITSEEEKTENIVSAAQILASCAHFASLRIAEKELRPASSMHLTRQETECIKWVSTGKTSKEISKIMAIAEPTVAFHLKNVMEKLGATNRPQALAIAIRLGYIN